MKLRFAVVAVLVAWALAAPNLLADVIVLYNADTTPFNDPATVASGVAASQLTIAPAQRQGHFVPFFVAFWGSNMYFSDDWDTSGPPASDQAYYEFQVTPPSGQALNLTGLTFNRTTATSGAGPNQWFLRTDQDGYTADLDGAAMAPGDQAEAATFSVFAFTPITFRLYGVNATSPDAGFLVDDVTLSGTITAVPEPASLFFGFMAVALLGWRRCGRPGLQR